MSVQSFASNGNRFKRSSKLDHFGWLNQGVIKLAKKWREQTMETYGHFEGFDLPFKMQWFWVGNYK